MINIHIRQNTGWDEDNDGIFKVRTLCNEWIEPESTVELVEFNFATCAHCQEGRIDREGV